MSLIASSNIVEKAKWPKRPQKEINEIKDNSPCEKGVLEKNSEKELEHVGAVGKREKKVTKADSHSNCQENEVPD